MPVIRGRHRFAVTSGESPSSLRKLAAIMSLPILRVAPPKATMPTRGLDGPGIKPAAAQSVPELGSQDTNIDVHASQGSPTTGTESQTSPEAEAHLDAYLAPGKSQRAGQYATPHFRIAHIFTQCI
ncbi:hypothetical protein PUNSTDRAFT_135829 [Punctularia strigosozonata HHB-11173 SS5]|uniref:uncharacterized protein n=1 Tax=Punctularia strigosozonata (strain HHB-11173) TaxID=741275 RepID=UPI0004418674|nr:uncharacterized protein PUNSTDRAFT_135829 [Punctularia strigosozonata HHB-11173 SS5]EIN07145.1 hypothetical protein PUNSTDRAFT_135829 [Punctularia strigosozonata HHB-11173 SS5]